MIYSIFISHAWEYNNEYYRLEEMLNGVSGFEWLNYSVPEHDALDTATNRELIEALIDQIRPTNVVIILSGMYTTYRQWIQTEINIAEELNKPILGVIPWGQERIPREVQDVADEMVGWNTSTIIDAIRGLSI